MLYNLETEKAIWHCNYKTLEDHYVRLGIPIPSTVETSSSGTNQMQMSSTMQNLQSSTMHKEQVGKGVSLDNVKFNFELSKDDGPVEDAELAHIGGQDSCQDQLQRPGSACKHRQGPNR